MIGHPEASGSGKYFHTFILLTIVQTFNQNVFVIISGKYIQPFNNREGNKVNSIRIMKFVIPAHLVSILFYYLKSAAK